MWVRDSVGRWRKVVCPKADAQNGVCTNEGLSMKTSVFVGTSVMSSSLDTAEILISCRKAEVNHMAMMSSCRA